MIPFSINASSEREVFLYAPVSNTQETWVNRVQTNMRTGSHHFVIYSFAANTPSLVIPQAGIVRDLKNSDGTYQLGTIAAMGVSRLLRRFAGGGQRLHLSGRCCDASAGRHCARRELPLCEQHGQGDHG